jgi:cholesterol transport system auxiliary component
MSGGLRLPLLAVTLALALAGCAFPPADPPATTFLLDQVPTGVPRGAPSPVTLIVFPIEARPAIDTTQMAYTVRPHQLAYFARNAWAEPPPRMLQPLLVRALEATGAYAAVVPPPHRTTGSLGVRTEILDLTQDFASDPPVLRLVVRVRLSDEAANRVIATREIVASETMQQSTPAAGVLAANDAVAKALRELAAFVLERSR